MLQNAILKNLFVARLKQRKVMASDARDDTNNKMDGKQAHKT
jgi:hypothetical protein